VSLGDIGMGSLGWLSKTRALDEQQRSPRVAGPLAQPR